MILRPKSRSAISKWLVHLRIHTLTLHSDTKIVCHELEVMIIFAEMCWRVEKQGRWQRLLRWPVQRHAVRLCQSNISPHPIWPIIRVSPWAGGGNVADGGGNVGEGAKTGAPVTETTYTYLSIVGRLENVSALLLVRQERAAVTTDYSANS